MRTATTGQEKVKEIQGGDVISGSIKCISQTPVELPTGSKGDNHQSEDGNKNIADGKITYQPRVSINNEGGLSAGAHAAASTEEPNQQNKQERSTVVKRRSTLVISQSWSGCVENIKGNTMQIKTITEIGKLISTFNETETAITITFTYIF